MLVAVHYLQCMMREIYPLWKRFYDSVFLSILQIFCFTRISSSHPQYMSCIYPANSQTWILSDLIRCDSIRNVTEMFWKDKDFFLKPRDKVCHHENWFCGQISQEIHLTVSFQLEFFVYFNFVFGKLNFKTKIFLIL